MRALVVDDHARIRELLRSILLDDGAFDSVELASDGLAALGLLLDQDFDLAIIDIELPGIDGFRLLEYVKLRRPKQSFLVLSALPVSEIAKRAAMLGAACFLPKGCLPSTILAASKRAVGR
jgi:two-component system, NarL family, invasion response regulator UvrY